MKKGLIGIRRTLMSEINEGLRENKINIISRLITTLRRLLNLVRYADFKTNNRRKVECE